MLAQITAYGFLIYSVVKSNGVGEIAFAIMGIYKSDNRLPYEGAAGLNNILPHRSNLDNSRTGICRVLN